MSQDIFVALAAPFPPDRVSWRVGSTMADKKKGMALAYIDARDVMDRLDAVVGPANWRRVHPHANGRTLCSLEIKIGGEWVAKEDGAGDTDVEAEKGALSDAFKRAAVNWGIGRYLYDLPSPWVEIEPAGKSFRIAAKEHEGLQTLLKRDARGFVSAASLAPKAKEEDPFSDQPPANDIKSTPHSRLMDQFRDQINGYTDTLALGAWWNGEDRKRACKDFELDQNAINELKQMVIARKAELEGKAAA